MKVTLPTNKRRVIERFMKRFRFTKPELVSRFISFLDILNIRSTEDSLSIAFTIIFVEEKRMLINMQITDANSQDKSCLILLEEDNIRILSLYDGKNITKHNIIHPIDVEFLLTVLISIV